MIQCFAIRIKEYARACVPASGCPHAVGVYRRAFGQTARQDNDITRLNFSDQRRQHAVQHILRNGQAGFIQVGIGVAGGIDYLEVGTGFPLHKGEIGLDAQSVHRVRDASAGRAAQHADGRARPADFGDDLGHIQSLAAGVGAQGRNAVDRVEREVRDLDGFIQCGVECYGIDHFITSC